MGPGEVTARPESTVAAIVEGARDVLRAEANAVAEAASRLTGDFARAAETIADRHGLLLVVGIGKSGHVGRKIAGTFCSVGVPSVFVHATEAMHGDLGLCEQGATAILISRSGSTRELLELAPVLKRRACPLIGLLGNMTSPLAREVDCLIDARVSCEADHLNQAPTCSTTVALALGDALAIAVMQLRRVTDEDFMLRHPAGQLGRNLTVKVQDAMHKLENVACVRRTDSMHRVVIAMTEQRHGAACVVDENGFLEGLITDGDLRRALQAHEEIRGLTAADIMTTEPVSVGPSALLKEAAELMERRSSQISVLPVVISDARCVGLIRIHDVYQSLRN